MILSFINSRKVPREVLKTEGVGPSATPSVFNTFLGTLRMLMNGKSCMTPLSEKQDKVYKRVTTVYGLFVAECLYFPNQ